MTELRFAGDDMRWLYETLIEACEVTRREGVRPVIVVNGKKYDDLLSVASLLPDEPLPSHHQLAADEMFKKRQDGYRRTGHNLAHRANQIASDARHREFMLKRGAENLVEQQAAKIAAQTGPAPQIRAARAMLNWSEAELAAAAGLTRNTIGKIEQGSMNPSKKTLGQLKAAFASSGVILLSPGEMEMGGYGVRLADGGE